MPKPMPNILSFICKCLTFGYKLCSIYLLLNSIFQNFLWFKTKPLYFKLMDSVWVRHADRLSWDACFSLHGVVSRQTSWSEAFNMFLQNAYPCFVLFFFHLIRCLNFTKYIYFRANLMYLAILWPHISYQDIFLKLAGNMVDRDRVSSIPNDRLL